nr:toprim domain-containing protein [Ensifer sp. ENS04]
MIRPLSATAIELCLCEGFETGLAIIAGGWRRPLFAMGGASFLAKTEPISQVRRLVIGADNDENGTGLRAAIQCGRRWAVAGTFVEVAWPEEISSDFADLPRGTRFP